MTLIQVVKDLFEKELFEDLIFYVELHLEPHNLEDELEKNEIVMLWKYVGDAHYQLDQYNPAVRCYDRSLILLKTWGCLKGNLSRMFSATEFKFCKYKCYSRLKKYEEGLAVLNEIPKNEHLPKTRLALAKMLGTKAKKSTSSITSNLLKQPKEVAEIVNCYNTIHTNVPNAFHSLNMLYHYGGTPKNEVSVDNDTVWRLFQSKKLRNESDPLAAIEMLKKADTRNLRVTYELAKLYNIVGNSNASISQLENLQKSFFPSVIGVDMLAKLYSEKYRLDDTHLEQLVESCLQIDDSAVQTFMALAYLARFKKKDLVPTFLNRAMLSTIPGPSRIKILLLKASFHIDQERHTNAEELLKQIFQYDHRNIDALELMVKLKLKQNSSDVKSVGEACWKAMGAKNPRSKYIYAHSMTLNCSYKPDYESYLESVAIDYSYVTKAVIEYAKLQESRKEYTKAIRILKNAIQFHPTPLLEDTLKEMDESNAPLEKDDTLIFKGECDTDAHSLSNSTRSLNTPEMSTPVGRFSPPASRLAVPAAPRRQRTNYRSTALEILHQPMEDHDDLEEMPRRSLNLSDSVDEEAMELDRNTPSEPLMEDLDDHELDDPIYRSP